MFFLNRTQSCYVGGLGEDESEEVIAEMDDKIKELKAVVSNKDLELEKLKETVRSLQEKIESNHANGHEEKDSNGDKDDITEETVGVTEEINSNEN